MTVLTQHPDMGEHAVEARALHKTLLTLREGMTARATARMAIWEPLLRRPEFRASAENLADYLALREVDISALQARFSALGLSSLGRAESHVRGSIDAVLASLARIGGQGDERHPAPEVFVAGKALLASRRDVLFGKSREVQPADAAPDAAAPNAAAHDAAAPGAASAGPQTRIMATLPSEAATDPALVQGLIEAGADCLRINCAHDGAAAWRAMAEHGRRAAAQLGREVVIEMDLAGPKIRLQEVSAPRKDRLTPGDSFVLTTTISKTEKRPQATLSHPEVLEVLVPGREVWINDGKLGGVVQKARPGHVVVEVTSTRAKGEHLKPEKGLNLPGSRLSIPALSEDDRRDLRVARILADLVAYSFVQSVADIEALFAALGPLDPGQPLRGLVLKIETAEALRNLPDLIVAAGGRMPVAVMIARGDLAVEIGFDRLSEIQEEILWLCEAAQVPVIWATQVLEGLIKEGQATRAEATDAAMAQRAECVMLNKGPFLADGVHFLADILQRMDRHQDKKSARLGALGLWVSR